MANFRRMRIIVFVSALFVCLSMSWGSMAHASDLSGRILLDVEQNGEAWYVNPTDGLRYYLGSPSDAFSLMRSFGLGISNYDLARFDESLSLRQDLAGRILLKVEDKGQAFFVDSSSLYRHYLGGPADALSVMSSLGLGISSADLARIPMAGSTQASTTTYLEGVPFVAQAPFGDWEDIRQQEACEETSVLMAMHWVWGDPVLTQQEALDEILKITNWEEETYGYHHDTSAADTVSRIFQEWFAFYNLDLRYDISTYDILAELEQENLVVAPIHGTLINNPYYSGPVERHMIVVNGYDAATNEFIIQDPGTRFGKDFRVSADDFSKALRDYTSGVYAPIGPYRTAMIVIYK